MKTIASILAQLLFVLAFLAVLLCIACAVEGGEYRRLRKETRITVVRPIRAQGRAHAGYPVAKTMMYSAGTAFRLSGLLNPIGWFFR